MCPIVSPGAFCLPQRSVSQFAIAWLCPWRIIHKRVTGDQSPNLWLLHFLWLEQTGLIRLFLIGHLMTAATEDYFHQWSIGSLFSQQEDDEKPDEMSCRGPAQMERNSIAFGLRISWQPLDETHTQNKIKSIRWWAEWLQVHLSDLFSDSTQSRSDAHVFFNWKHDKYSASQLFPAVIVVWNSAPSFRPPGSTSINYLLFYVLCVWLIVTHVNQLSLNDFSVCDWDVDLRYFQRINIVERGKIFTSFWLKSLDLAVSVTVFSFFANRGKHLSLFC